MTTGDGADIGLELDTIYCGDCLEIMKQIEGGVIDLVLTDPPYNLGINYGDNYNDSKKYDDYLSFSLDWFKEARRISNSVIFTPGWNNLRMWLNDIEYPKGIAIWYVPNQKSHSPLGGWNHWEPILVYGKINLGKNVFKKCVFAQKHIEGHPCPKQHGLYLDILNCLSPRPNIILDPFMGSGSSIIATKLFNSYFIGIEINPEYCKIAEKRLQNIPSKKLEDYT